MGRRTIITSLAVAAAAALTAVAPAAAAPRPEPYQQNDYRGFNDVLPPGTNGFVNAADLTLFLTTGRRPPHNNDQLGMYGDLVYNSPRLKRSEFRNHFKDASFGVRPGDVERQYSPRGDVTIQRDKGFGVPRVYGENRDGTMFGAGYVAAEDRLFFIDVLRNVGRARLSSFAGGSPGNREMDATQWALAPYTEADLERQVDQLDDLYGAEGRQIQRDAEAYVAGINTYIQEQRLNPSKRPGEYFAINRPQGPDDWKATDIIATAALVGGIFGKGGGGELESTLALQAAQKKFGASTGRRVWSDFRSAQDPETPTTVRNRPFPYQPTPRTPAAGSRAIPDEDTVERDKIRQEGSSPLGGSGGSGGPGGLVALPSANSNALVVSGRESRSGRPLAVFGPQTGYFSPQILMELEMHAPASAAGPGIDARGAAFPGVNLYVQLGRGRDYSWSATSAGQDITDTFALDLCNPDGSPATKSSTSYMFRGRCVAMEPLERNNTWTPNAADQTPPGSETLRVFRTKLGIVKARGEIGGRPVAYALLRSTYLHEVDSARGFVDFNDPEKMENPREFQRAANKIGYTFNWLYTDDRDIAYFNSGANPVRAPGVDPDVPTRGRPEFEWRGFDPERQLADFTPFSAHPQVVNQSYLTSWNNKQAPGVRSADGNYSFGSVHRVQPLDDRIQRGIRGPRKMSLLQLTDAMEDAGTVDLRGDKVLPLALRVIGRTKDPALADAVAKLTAWERAGAHRRDRDRNGVYEHTEAIRIMDAWWPRLLKAEFRPVLGEDLFSVFEGRMELDNEPNNKGQHLGSAYQNGWYGYASKDLRTILGDSVKGRYSRVYCGRGDRGKCRSALLGSLRDALAVPREQLYGGDRVCEQEANRALDDQFCFDAVLQRPLGGVSQPLIHWINRPTYQMVNEIRGHRGRAAQRRRGDGRRSPRFTG